MKHWIALFYIICLGCLQTLYAQQSNEFYRWNETKNNYEFDFTSSNQQKALDSLTNNGYYTLQIDSIRNHKVYLNKGKNYKTIWVKNEQLFGDSNYHPTNNLDSIISYTIDQNDKQGYAFSNVRIIPQGLQDNNQKIELRIEHGELRKIDHVIAVGYPKLSKGYIKHGLGLKNSKLYTNDILAQSSRVMQNTNFIEELQSPQTLFRPDSTVVYIYPKKIKSNTFDGILGFGNDDNGNFKLNGNVLLELNNVFNGLEQIRLNWVATANKNTTLDIRVKLPYLFKSPIGSETQFKVFKQDSVFVNLDLNERLFYQINPQSSIGANLSYTSSNYLLDDEVYAASYDDYNKTGIGLSYEYFLRHPIALMEGKSLFRIQASSIKRKETNFSLTEDYTNETSKQFEISLSTYRIIEFGKKHYLKPMIMFSALLDEEKSYSENELYRIGGFGSLRGFNEESILANMYGIGSLEYRFLANEGFYISSFLDYAFIENKRINLNTNFLSFGAGLSFLTKIGIFNLSYAVGKTEQTPFDFKNSKIHFGILSQF